MSLNKRNFTRAIYVFDAVVQRVPSDKWDNQSPCDEWTARDVLRHQCGVLQAMAATLKSGETVPPQPIDSAETPAAVWAETRDSVLAELDEPEILDREGKFWFGPMSVDQWIQVVQWDPITHAWDISKAAGIEPEATGMSTFKLNNLFFIKRMLEIDDTTIFKIRPMGFIMPIDVPVKAS